MFSIMLYNRLIGVVADYVTFVYIREMFKCPSVLSADVCGYSIKQTLTGGKNLSTPFELYFQYMRKLMFQIVSDL